ncbi:cytochrome P450 CYP736A12 [Ricinus communis]|uniref:Flavonoid 3-hydroxylase, putative n=1 Tax=Ricinus communis TaxID=3988 RepID=B9RLJ1_RICCO|nr:cytochrome P450 CYP736A12 [Ricinus communis]EEF47716.1 flavonoid 3-hydroxylase, putative [Ricinus communis]|eukprot:XP_002514610.1 cytochrome P450 CYP736A12 [Ricinus communis]
MSTATLAILLFILPCLLPLIYILSTILRCPKPRKHHRNDLKPLPPGPRPLPIIGNLHLLGLLPHQSLYHLAKEHGQIMFLKLGFVDTVVVSSAQAAELFLKTHDAAFANRPKVLVSHYLSYGSRGMIFDDYGPYWRNVRKVCTLQLLSSSKIESFAPLRKEELELMVATIKQAAERKEMVDVSARLGDFSENLICRMIFGQRSNDEFDLRPLIKESLELIGAINIADYVPYIGVLDLQGLTRRMRAYRKGMDKVLEKIIDSHEKDGRWKTKEQKDFIDVMLSVMNRSSPMIPPNDPQSYVIDRTCIKAIIQDIIVGGFETSTSSIEWTFSELLRHPRVMKCLQKELETVVGLDRMVEERDLPNLTYLDMIVKESLRLYPTLPLIPRKCVEDITVNGYHIPSNSRILVNAWAIGRDTNVWSDNALEFYPERFKDECVDLRGLHFQLIPFGSGRRSCPGMSLGLRNIRLVIAQLAHCFNWDLPSGDLDMTEKYGLTLPRANHFSALPTYRLHV